MRAASRILGIAFAASAALAMATPAQADWITDKLSDSCSGASAQKLGQSVRQNIEDSVKRAEAAIQPPSPVGDLGCLTNLMDDIDIDFFSGGNPFAGGFDVQSIISQVGFDDVLGDMAGGGDPMSQVCSFAKEKWSELTSPLKDALGDMSLPSLGDSFNLGSFKLPDGSASSAGTQLPAANNPSATQPFANPDASAATNPASGSEAGDLAQDQIDQMWRGLTNTN